MPVPYFHVVYTLPSKLRDIAYQNKRVVYDLLMKATAETTLAIAADPKRLGAYCYDNVDPSVPTLVLIGEKDDWTPAANCQAVKGKANFEVVVYPGATHAFTMQMDNVVYLGHHMTYDEKATKDAQERAAAFLAAHLK